MPPRLGEGGVMQLPCSGKPPSLEEFLPQGRRSQKSFYPRVPSLTSFFDFFDFAVHFFFTVCRL
jgi:hypothetical protein